MRWAAQRIVWLVVSLLALQSFAKKEKPAIEVTTFDTDVVGLVYFEDSDVLLFTDQKTGGIWQSNDAGFKWSPVEGVQGAIAIIKHPYDGKTAVVLGADRTNWITKDQAKTWSKFRLPALPKLGARPLSFHASDPDRILIHTEDCEDLFSCTFPVYYTLDGFDTEAQELRDDALSCVWAKTAKEFSTGDQGLDKTRVLCTVEGTFSIFDSDSRILISDDFFNTKGQEPLLDGDRPVSGIINVASVTRYLAAAAKSERSSELALYVTDDSMTWQRAEFGQHKIEEDAYTILESTNYSMQVDVQTGRSGMTGALYTSNYRGTFFTKNIVHTNRNEMGYVDFEKIQDISGIVLVNLVDNAKEVESKRKTAKDIITKISFDDGRDWQDLMFGKEKLHLHSVTDQRNIGRVYSSPAPGIIMGVGNTGSSLKSRQKGDTFVSDDAGLTWTQAAKGPHLYEMGDQGALLVMVADEVTDEILWSIDHGKTWDKADIGHKVNPIALTTTPDSTSLKFLLIAESTKKSDEGINQIIALDFAELHEKKCGKDDFVEWYARVDEDDKPLCLMGHTLMFRRRKADADCFVDEEFKDPIPLTEHCKCTDEDYECDYNFIKDEDGKCVPDGEFKAPKGECEGEKGTYMGSSGYRLIPGNTCTQRGGVTKDEPVERKCHETSTRPASGDINSTVTRFPDEYKTFLELYYLERCEQCSGDDETIVVRTDNDVVLISDNHGKDWRPLLDDNEKITGIFPHLYFNDQVFFTTKDKKVYYSKNRGRTIDYFDVPEPPASGKLPLSFHPQKTDWLIWVGERKGKTISQVSKKHGDSWETLLHGVERCDFIYREGRSDDTTLNLIYCEQHEDEDPKAPLILRSSNDSFVDDNQPLQEDVVNFATMSEFIVVARHDKDGDSLRADASIDGRTFADVKFPRNFKVDTQVGYTVLDSSTHAIFMHVTVSDKEQAEYGAIIKSNSNGTDYTLAINNVNRDRAGYVDFEKVQGLEGVSVVNVVTLPEFLGGGNSKQLKTMITHNDGAEWATIARPKDSGEFKTDWCNGSPEDCSLHLHGYTERTDPRSTLSSPTAIGILFGNGNVGQYLSDIEEADTFMSTDGGIEWHMVEEGKWLWEFGDRGSIIVIVRQNTPTKELKYTLDEGKSWQKYTFSDEEMVVQDLTSVPSDTSRNFLLLGTIKKGLTTVNIDFSGLEERSKQCTLDEDNPTSDDDDYYLWSPKHPLSDSECLFGHIAKYHRKIVDKECYNGRRMPVLHDVVQNCECTRQDFECDYNYERSSGGDCLLVAGLDPIDPSGVCAQNGTTEYSEVTGYRRIPLTTCQGGKEYDYSRFRTKPCPGYEDDYNTKHGISGAGLFFAIVIPLLAASAAGWWVWRNWDGKFGRIQLGDNYATGSRIGLGGAFERDAPWIKYPVLAVSALVAVIAAVPMMVSTVWRTLRPRSRYGSYGSLNRPYTSRGSFQRGRGNYSVVDEGELLGDESEDEET